MFNIWIKQKSLTGMICQLNITLVYPTFKNKFEDFPGGAVVKNPPANAGDMGSSPGPGRFHMPRSN